MKLKYRLLFALCVLFIVFVSFKILQPEIDEREKGVNTEPVQQGVEDMLLEHYALDWDTELSVDDAWNLAASGVSNRAIHPDKAPRLGGVLRQMSEARIVHAGLGIGGSQLKLTLTLQGGQRVIFKPKWYERDHVVHGKPYQGRDRHNAEVLAFHLNRLLGFNRAPLAVGRTVDLLTELIPVADEALLKTFFKRGDNTCFYGQCLYCKSEKDGACAEGGVMEGSVLLWLPQQFPLRKWAHPWRRSYKDGVNMRWEVDNSYCNEVMKTEPYSSGPALMDIIDTTVLDFLIGNADRHHYETFRSPNSILVMLDNAKSLGNPHTDEVSILAPLYQCCKLRLSTYERLQLLQGGVLSRVLERLMSRDPITPVASPLHYTAIDRRLTQILNTVSHCIDKHGEDSVLTYS